MKLYIIAFNGMDENAVGKVVASHGGKLYAVSKNHISYLATEGVDTEILVDLVEKWSAVKIERRIGK